MVKHTVVLYPSPGVSHLIPMVELAKLILKHHPSLSITILNTPAPFDTSSSTSSYINQISQTIPSLHFHHLPTLTLPSSNSSHRENLAFQLIELSKPLVHQALETLISQSDSIKAFVLDMFCSSSADISEKIGIPTFHFFTSGISSLAAYLHLPYVMETLNFDEPNSFWHNPGRVPILVSDMPKNILERGVAYQGFLKSSKTMVRSQGIFVNSFESLESDCLKVMREGMCVPDAPTPPIFCIGPLIADNNHNKRYAIDSQLSECLSWLDSQPSRSVVFLSFGSVGLFSEAQLKEIAIGLENSGQRFLWVVRSPPLNQEMTRTFWTPPDPDLEALLPSGFLDRVKDRGLVDVLSHESVGGFVTHCGWNSIMEAVCAGVPMVAWPLYAEQKLNRVFLVEESGIGLPMMESENGIVNACEVEKRVRQLMESNDGNVVRGRVMEMSRQAKAAISDGGSSVKDLNEFVIELYRLSNNDANLA